MQGAAYTHLAGRISRERLQKEHSRSLPSAFCRGDTAAQAHHIPKVAGSFPTASQPHRGSLSMSFLLGRGTSLLNLMSSGGISLELESLSNYCSRYLLL